MREAWKNARQNNWRHTSPTPQPAPISISTKKLGESESNVRCAMMALVQNKLSTRRWCGWAAGAQVRSPAHSTSVKVAARNFETRPITLVNKDTDTQKVFFRFVACLELRELDTSTATSCTTFSTASLKERR